MAAVAELTAVAAMMTAVRTAAKMVAIMVAAGTVAETVVGVKDNGCNSNGRGHKQQST